MVYLKKGMLHKAIGWLSLGLFLLAYLGSEIPVLHSGHHGAAAALTSPDPVRPGEAAFAAEPAAGHACLLCLWKSHRDAGEALGAGPDRHASLPAPAPGPDFPAAPSLEPWRTSGPARAPPSLS